MFTGNRRVLEALRNLSIIQSRSVRYGPLSFIVFVVVSGTFAFWAVETYHPWGSGIKGTDALTALLGLGAFLIGFHQWRGARNETSLERFYDRLKLANDARTLLNHEDQKIDPMDLYAYMELDNLEYVLEKYRLGYMAPEHALRGVNTFQSRMGIPGFRDTLTRLGDLGQRAGYQQQTSEVVSLLLSRVNPPTSSIVK